MQRLTFINHDAKHQKTSSRDLSTIRARAAKLARQAQRQRNEHAEDVSSESSGVLGRSSSVTSTSSTLVDATESYTHQAFSTKDRTSLRAGGDSLVPSSTHICGSATARPEQLDEINANQMGLRSTTGQSLSRRLKRDGLILRYKLGTSLPSQSSRDTVKDVSDYELVDSTQQHAIPEDEDHHAMQNGGIVMLTRHYHHRRIHDFSLMPPPIGGLREDPFNTFPVERKPYIASAFDHCELAIIVYSWRSNGR